MTDPDAITLAARYLRLDPRAVEAVVLRDDARQREIPADVLYEMRRLAAYAALMDVEEAFWAGREE
jgi:hypothetical protein